MKIISFYLPQFHEIPENNKWWGKGFTEWTNMKKAIPLFDGHYQPRIPLDKNYYDLGEGTEIQRWQCQIAREYGIYGFCFYHYWFNGYLLLQKPVENYLQDTKCDLPFCLCWANESWTQAWVSKEDSVLFEQTYGGEEEWSKHFNYLLPFLKDERYITINGDPLIVLYRPELIDHVDEMIKYWKKMARANGFNSLAFAYQHPNSDDLLGKKKRVFDYGIDYQPAKAYKEMQRLKVLRKIKSNISKMTEKYFGNAINLGSIKAKIQGDDKPEIIDYDRVWESILSAKAQVNHIPGAFVDWDNTPRRGTRGRTYIGSTPAKFEKYMKQMIIKAKKEYKQDMMFIFAWNEWAEGGILEPTERDGYGYLNAIKNALEMTDEWPWQGILDRKANCQL